VSGPGVPWRPAPGGLVLDLRVTPNAAFDRIDGVEQRADGRLVLRLRVRAVPDRGRANAAVIVVLAGALDLPKSAIRLVSGDTSRDKTVALAGDARALEERLAALA